MRYEYKITPYEHQVVALRALLKPEFKDAILNLDPGMGKTKICVDFAAIQHLKHEYTRVLIVLPKYLRMKWVEELMDNLPDDIDYRIHSIRSGSNKEQKVAQMWAGIKDVGPYITFILVSYDTLKNQPFDECLFGWQPQIIFCDEAHHMAGYKSKRNAALCMMRHHAQHKIAVSATSLTKNPLRGFGMYKFINDSVFGMHVTKFKDQYAVQKDFRVIGWRNLDELRQKMKTNMITMKKEDWLRDSLPQKIWNVVPVEMDDRTVVHYNKLLKDMITMVDEKRIRSTNVGVNRMKLQQMTSGFAVTKEGEEIIIDSSKLDATMELLEDLIEADRKVVIVSRFVFDIKRLHKACKEKGIAHGIIFGDIPESYRERFREQFQHGSLNVILLQSGSGEGIDLYAGSDMIFYSMPAGVTEWQQVQDRIHRIGSKHDSVTYHLMMARTEAKKSIDYDIFNKHCKGVEFVDSFLSLSEVDQVNYLEFLEV